MQIITVKITERTTEQLQVARIAADVCGPVNGQGGVSVLFDGPSLRGERDLIKRVIAKLNLNRDRPAYYPQ